MADSEKTSIPEDQAEKIARLQKYLDIFKNALKMWEEDHPHWRYEVLLWVLDKSLSSLRAYIEMETENEISWDSPFVRLHFPVDCVWDEATTAENPRFHFDTGTLNADELTDTDSASAVLSRLLVRHIEIVALQDWTNQSAFEKRGEVFRPIGTVEDVERVKAIVDPVERARVGKALFSGTMFGAGLIDLDESSSEYGITEETADQLTEIEPPLVFLPLEIDGHKIRVITILQIEPPVADADTKQAYFPIGVGIAVQADEGEEVTPEWLDQPWAQLSKWTAQDRDLLWDAFHQIIKGTLESLGPASEPEMIEAIVSVNAEIKVAMRKGDEARIQEAIAGVLAELQKNGEILSFTAAKNQTPLLNPGTKAKVEAMLDAVVNSSSNDEKGRSLETLVSELFSSIPYFEISERVRTQTEEIDIWITNNANSGPFFREGDIVLVECKNWSEKCGKNEYNSLLMKMMNRSGRCTVSFLISWNGFAETVAKEMLRGSRDSLLIVPLDGDDIRRAVASGDFMAVLSKKRMQALET